MDKQIVTVVVGCLVALGCGSSNKTTPPDNGTGGTGSSGTSSAAGGTTSTAGMGMGIAATGAAGNAVTEVLVPCGPTMCASSSASPFMGVGIMIAAACCADETNGVCGSMSADPSMTDGMTCLVSPPAAPNCPKMFNMPACCVTSKQICGIDGTLAGRGCVDPDTLTAMIPAMFRNFLMLPPRTMCDGTLAPVPDAGMTGTGGSSATGEDAGL